MRDNYSRGRLKVNKGIRKESEGRKQQTKKGIRYAPILLSSLSNIYSKTPLEDQISASYTTLYNLNTLPDLHSLMRLGVL